MHRSARSAAARRAVPCPAGRCRTVRYCAMLCGPVRSCAVLCRAVPCCPVLNVVLYLLFFRAYTNVVSCQVPADLSLVHRLSSARLSSASQRWLSRAQRRAVLCRAACFAVPARSYMPVSFEIPYHVPVLLHQVRTCYVVESQTMHSQLSSAQLYIAQQRSAAPCGAVRCCALPGVAVLCRAALCFLSNRHQYQV